MRNNLNKEIGNKLMKTQYYYLKSDDHIKKGDEDFRRNKWSSVSDMDIGLLKMYILGRVRRKVENKS